MRPLRNRVPLVVVEALARLAKDRSLKRSRRQFASDAVHRYHRTGMLDPHACARTRESDRGGRPPPVPSPP